MICNEFVKDALGMLPIVGSWLQMDSHSNSSWFLMHRIFPCSLCWGNLACFFYFSYSFFSFQSKWQPSGFVAFLETMQNWLSLLSAFRLSEGGVTHHSMAFSSLMGRAAFSVLHRWSRIIACGRRNNSVKTAWNNCAKLLLLQQASLGETLPFFSKDGSH